MRVCRRARESAGNRSVSQRSSLAPADTGSTVRTVTDQTERDDLSVMSPSAKSATPTVMAESATLNAGQCQPRK
jgi:hypothetical protein